MTKLVRGSLVLAGCLSWCVAGHAGGDKDAMTENPKFRFWAHFKKGATSTYSQTTKFHGAEKASVPGGVEHKTITYRLLSVNKDRAVVLTTVVEKDFLSTVESAPTRITYPAQVRKADLQAFLQEWNAKEGKDETLQIGGKDIRCKVRAGSQKIEGGTVEFKVCYSDKVPGGFVKRTRTTREGDKVIAETTTTLVSFAEKSRKERD